MIEKKFTFSVHQTVWGYEARLSDPYNHPVDSIPEKPSGDYRSTGDTELEAIAKLAAYLSEKDHSHEVWYA
jgi:hypothetical protein